MFIQNASLHDIITGNHKDPGENSMLIQILDPGYEPPLPHHQFAEMHQLEMTDVDRPTDVTWVFRMTRQQGERIITLLESAKERGMNVIVHCHAGVCRSGAVVEIGVMMGFEDTGEYRLPNRYMVQVMKEYINEK